MNDPLLFKTSVPLAVPVTWVAVSGEPSTSVSLPSTPGAANVRVVSCAVAVIVPVAGLAGAPDTV